MANTSIAPAARGGLNHHSYNPITIATLDYGEFVNTRSIECEKSDDWKHCKGDGFLRLAPLDFPAYGRTFFKQAAFFVPYYQIIENIDGFRANKVADRSMPCIMPVIRADVAQQICSNTNYCTVVASQTYAQAAPSRSTYDFVVLKDNSGASQYDFCKLNHRGKHIYKWLKSLGYDWYQYISNAAFTTVNNAVITVNALPILCYAKIWLDYFCNLHLYEGSPVLACLTAIKHGESYVTGGNVYYDATTGVLSPACAKMLFDECAVPFESSLYLDAWNTENSPIGSVANDKGAVVNSSLIGPHLPAVSNNQSSAIGETSEFDYLTTGNMSNSIVDLTQFGINSLYSFYQFAKRNKLFGSESCKQAFARFGIKGDDFNSLFVRKLFEGSQEIDFSAVMSNSNTVDPNTGDGSYLGAYAGVGLCSLNFNYNYKVSDYGLILNLAWLQIIPMQIHGFDPSVLRTKPFDWWTPEFDGKAIRAIPYMEITAPQTQVTNTAQLPDSVYGFIGIYDDYRRMRDMVLGDFCFGATKKFFFGRDLTPHLETYRFAIHPQQAGIQYFSRYNADPELTDPFQFDVSNGDRFYLQMNWEFEADRQLLSTADSLDLRGSGEIQTTTDSNPNA